MERKVSESSLDSSKKVRSKTHTDKGEDLLDDDGFSESDEFYKKWSGPVLLGPFLVAIFAALIIVSGQLVLNTSTAVVTANIAISYLFLLVFTWVYLGENIRITIPVINFDRVVLRPFRSLRWIMYFYFALAIGAFVVGIYGTFILALSTFCSTTASELYHFTMFAVVLFWVGFFAVACYTVKLFYGTRISKILEEKMREETVEEVENRLVRAKFMEYDKTKQEQIERSDLNKVLQALGVFVPEEEQEHLADTLDPTRSGFIAFKPFAEWFRVANGSNKDEEENDEDKQLFS
eukprot:scaffold229_cov155-Ochromonas_danica.AAC.6